MKAPTRILRITELTAEIGMTVGAARILFVRGKLVFGNDWHIAARNVLRLVAKARESGARELAFDFDRLDGHERGEISQIANAGDLKKTIARLEDLARERQAAA